MTVLLIVAGAAVAAAPPPTPPPGATSPGSALDAAEALNDVAWRPVGRAAREGSQDWLEKTFERTLASGNGKVGPAKWNFSLKVDDVDSRVDFSQAPGFRAISSNGFTLGFPRQGTWRIGAAATVKGKAKVKLGGETIFSWSPSLRLSLTLPRFRASVSGSWGATLSNLTGGSVAVEGGFEGGGTLPESSPVNFGPATENGNPGVAGQVNIPLDLPVLKARLKGEMRVILEPSEPLDELGVEIPDLPFGVRGGDVRNVLNLLLPFQELRITIKGKLEVKLKRVGERRVPFELTFGVPIISAPEVNTLLLAMRALSGLQPNFGIDPASPTPPPASDVDARLAAAAVDLEQRILSHLPNGTIYALDKPTEKSPQAAYSNHIDSAIWTGHYLTAEALRYGATRTPASLDRVRTVMGGVERLFQVTQDAYQKNGTRRAVPARFRPDRVFARAVLPGDSPIQTLKQFKDGDCFFEDPEGGWRLTAGRGRPAQTFEFFRDAEGARAQLPSTIRPRAEINPLGRVWYGFGCGDRGPAISRDQYAGIFMGLTFVHRLVDDPQLKEKAAYLIDQALDFLISNNYEIIVPPDVHGQHYWFSWDKQIALLRLGAEVRPGRYQDRWLKAAAALPTAWIPGFFSGVDPLHQYYKYNLAQATVLPALFLEQNDAVRAGFKFMRDVTNLPIRHHKNAWFTVSEILGELPGDRKAAAQAAAESNPQITKAQEIRTLLSQWLERRDDPDVRGPNNLPLEAVPDPDFLSNLWPADVTRYRKLSLGVACYSRYVLPVHKRIGRGMHFIWQRHPFDVGMKSEDCLPAPRGSRTPPGEVARNGAPAPQREGQGVDFLLPYWAGVYAGIIPPPAG